MFGYLLHYNPNIQIHEKLKTRRKAGSSGKMKN